MIRKCEWCGRELKTSINRCSAACINLGDGKQAGFFYSRKCAGEAYAAGFHGTPRTWASNAGCMVLIAFGATLLGGLAWAATSALAEGSDKKQPIAEKVADLQKNVEKAGYLVPEIHPDFYAGKGLYAPNVIQPDRWKVTPVRTTMVCRKYTEGSDVNVYLPVGQNVGNQVCVACKPVVELDGKQLDASQFTAKLTKQWLHVRIPKATFSGKRVTSGSFKVHADSIVLHGDYTNFDPQKYEREIFQWASKLKTPAPAYTLPTDFDKLSSSAKGLLKKAKAASTLFGRIQIGFRAACELPWNGTVGIKSPDSAVLMASKGDCGTKAALAIAVIRDPESMHFFSGFVTPDPKFGGAHAFLGVVLRDDKGKQWSFLMDPFGSKGYVGPQCLGETVPGTKQLFGHFVTNTSRNGSNGGLFSASKAGVKFDRAVVSWPTLGPHSKGIPAYQKEKVIRDLAAALEETRLELYSGRPIVAGAPRKSKAGKKR